MVLRDLQARYESREDPSSMAFEAYLDEYFGAIDCTEELEGIWVHMWSGDLQIRGGSVSYLIDKRDGSILRREFGR